MRQITLEVEAAFMAGRPKKVGNTRTDGQAIYLHDRKIVERRPDGIYVSLGGYGFSRTTQERLKPFAYVWTKNDKVFLGRFDQEGRGEVWDGEWTRV